MVPIITVPNFDLTQNEIHNTEFGILEEFVDDQ